MWAKLFFFVYLVGFFTIDIKDEIPFTEYWILCRWRPDLHGRVGQNVVLFRRTEATLVQAVPGLSLELRPPYKTHSHSHTHTHTHTLSSQVGCLLRNFLSVWLFGWKILAVIYKWPVYSISEFGIWGSRFCGVCQKVTSGQSSCRNKPFLGQAY